MDSSLIYIYASDPENPFEGLTYTPAILDMFISELEGRIRGLRHNENLMGLVNGLLNDKNTIDMIMCYPKRVELNLVSDRMFQKGMVMSYVAVMNELVGERILSICSNEDAGLTFVAAYPYVVDFLNKKPHCHYPLFVPSLLKNIVQLLVENLYPSRKIWAGHYLLGRFNLSEPILFDITTPVMQAAATNQVQFH